VSHSLDDADLIAELATNTREEVESRRIHARFAVAVPIVAHAGNLSDRSQPPIAGTSVDVSQSGCLVIFDRAVHVGDIYRLDIDGARTRFPQLFARCIRARLLHDTAIEAAFVFFIAMDATELRAGMQRVTGNGPPGTAARPAVRPAA